MSLCDSIKSALDTADQEDTYGIVLKGRLSAYGVELQSRVNEIPRMMYSLLLTMVLDQEVGLSGCAGCGSGKELLDKIRTS